MIEKKEPKIIGITLEEMQDGYARLSVAFRLSVIARTSVELSGPTSLLLRISSAISKEFES